MSIAIPVATYTLMLLFLYGYMPKIDPLHLFIVATCILISAGSILLVAAGFPMTLSLAMLTVPPALAIILDDCIGTNTVPRPSNLLLVHRRLVTQPISFSQ